MKLERYQALLEAVEQTKRRHDQAVGAKDQLLSQLQSQFGCSTLQEARAELEKRETIAKKRRERCEAALTAFEEKWKDVILRPQ